MVSTAISPSGQVELLGSGEHGGLPALHALPAIVEALGELAGPRRALSLAVRAGVQEEAFRALPHPCPAQNAWCSGHCAAPPAQPESIGARAAGPEADGVAGTSFAAQ